MAQIPTGNFGTVVAQPGQAVNVGQVDVSSGIEKLASDVGAVNKDYQQQQATAKAALALATSQNAIQDAHQQVAAGVTDGSIPTEQAGAELDKRVAAIKDTSTQGLTEPHAAAVQASIIGTAGAAARDLNGVVVKRQQSESLATLDAFQEQVQREAPRIGLALATEKFNAFADFVAPLTGLNPQQFAAKKQAVKEGMAYSTYDQQATNLLVDGNLSGMTDLLHKVMGPDGDALDPTKRAALTHTVLGYNNKIQADQLRAQNAAEAARVARENGAADAYNAALDLTVKGNFLSPDAIKTLATAAAGTSVEKDAGVLLASQSHIAGFASMPYDQRQAVLNGQRSQAANPAVGTDPLQAKMLALYEKVDSGLNEKIKNDPWSAAQSSGVIKTAPLVDASNPDNVMQLLDRRMHDIGTVEAWAGAKVSPLQPHEAEQLEQSLKGMPPAQAASTLSMIGQMVGEPQRIASVAKQLGDKDGTLGLAMAYAGDKSNDGKLTAEYILRGDLALKNKTAAVDQSRQTGWRATIFDKINGAFSSQDAENKAVDAAFKITAANGGDTDAAIKMATGGIATHGTAGAKIPLPVGVDENDFEKRIKAYTPAMLASQAPDGNVLVGRTPLALPDFVKSLETATLVHAGQGQYAVKAGNSFVTNSAGARIVIRVTQ